MWVRGKTRARLTKAARKVFSRKGYHTATMDDIARTAGIAKGTIYQYIRHKDDLVAMLAEEEMNSILAQLQEISASQPTATLRLRSGVSVLLEQVLEYQKTGLAVMMRDIYGVKGKVREKVYEQKQKILLFFSEVFDEGIRQGEFRKIDADMASFIIFSLVGALVHKEMRFNIENPQTFVRDFMDILENGVKSR